MHELALGITSTNLSPDAGPVRNPYDPRLIAGGSSGGTAAAIAARIVPAGPRHRHRRIDAYSGRGDGDRGLPPFGW